MNKIQIDIEKGNRFHFGENWKRFLLSLNEKRIDYAISSLQKMLDAERLNGKTFLDIGSGSGLFSLAARKLGANVHSFDYDPQSVSCTRELKYRFDPEACAWTIEEGSILDDEYILGLGTFDIVYSWGVLHHTGNMYKSLEISSKLVKMDGLFFIAIYNNQGWISRYWFFVKFLWNKVPWLRWFIILMHAPTHLIGRYLYRYLSSKGDIRRGMSLWRDLIDWLGGFPFETATTSTIIEYVEDFGFQVIKYSSCGKRHGCNEFLFRRINKCTKSL